MKTVFILCLSLLVAIVIVMAELRKNQIAFNASQQDLTSCKENVEFMKQGLEDIISTREGK